MLEGLAKETVPAGQVRVHNRESAKAPGTPFGVKDAPDANQNRGAMQEAAIIEVQNRAPNTTRTAAYEIASREKPELFTIRK